MSRLIKYLRTLTIIIFLLNILSGCAGIKGAPDSTVSTEAAKTDLECYLKANVLINEKCDSAGSSHETTREWRDNVINSRLTVADLLFRDFKNDLTSQGTSFNIFSDLAVLGLSAAGALASGGTTNILAAASAGVTGARGAVDKDVYYRETLPGLISTMEAARKEVLLDIKTNMKQLDENQYTVGDALLDLQRYETAGTLSAALGIITGKAQEAAQKADEDLKTAAYASTIVSAEIQTRKKQLFGYIRELVKNNQKTELDNIASLLSITSTSEIKDERKAILLELDKRITSSASMDAVSGLLHSITNKVF